MKANNIFSNLIDFKDETFETLLESKNLKIERIVSDAHVSPKDFWYDQEEDEWVIVLQGGAVVGFDNKESANLGVGDYLHIKTHQKHRVEWTSEKEKTVWLAIHIKIL